MHMAAKTLKYNLLIAISLFLLQAVPSHACFRIPDTDLTLTASYGASRQSFTSNATDLSFGYCRRFKGQYFVLVNAPSYFDPLFNTLSVPEGDLPAERCYIDNSPFKVSAPSDVNIDSFYSAEANFMNHCLEAEVSDSRGSIDTGAQVNCDIKQIASNVVIAKGPRCSFKIYEESAFNVHYRMNPKCLNKEFLKNNGIRPMDVRATLGIYRTPDASPESSQYSSLGFINSRISLLPDSELLPVFSDKGIPGSEWPSQYGVQVELGKLLFARVQRQDLPSIILVRAPFMVNNNCSEVCKDGLCSSPCDYNAPVVANMKLEKKDLDKQGFAYIDSWYQGTVVPSRFLGELVFGHSVPDMMIKVGDTFMITAEFSDPTMSYKRMMSRPNNPQDKSKIVSFPINGRALSVTANSFWPPYYSSIINESLTDTPNQVFQVLKITFRIADVSSSGALTIDQIRYSKESKIFGNYDVPMTAAPEVKCSAE